MQAMCGAQTASTGTDDRDASRIATFAKAASGCSHVSSQAACAECGTGEARLHEKPSPRLPLHVLLRESTPQLEVLLENLSRRDSRPLRPLHGAMNAAQQFRDRGVRHAADGRHSSLAETWQDSKHTQLPRARLVSTVSGSSVFLGPSVPLGRDEGHCL